MMREVVKPVGMLENFRGFELYAIVGTSGQFRRQFRERLHSVDADLHLHRQSTVLLFNAQSRNIQVPEREQVWDRTSFDHQKSQVPSVLP